MAELVPTSIHQRRRLSSSPLVTAARTLAASLSQTRLLQSTLSQGGGFSSVASSSSSSTFDWYKEWYPLVPVDLLDTEIPHKFTLFGVDIVVWKDSPLMMSNSGKSVSSFGPKPAKRKRSEDGEWRAFVDECPHRLVPLSEGRVENDGSLLCSYHAWRFNGTGHLIDVPQLESSLSIERLKDNPRSRCNSFPTRVVDGVLWVWPQTGDDAIIESALKSVSKYQVPEGIDVSRVWFGPWDFRVLPYGADFFFENVVDPAHVQVR